MKLTNYEITILRDLAKKITDLSARHCESEKISAWTAHNDLSKGSRPMVFCDPENGWNEIITQNDLKCASPLARQWEFKMRKDIFSAEKMEDDKVISPEIEVNNISAEPDWGLKEMRQSAGQNGAYHVIPALDSYDKLSLMKYPEPNLDFNQTNAERELAREVFDGILQVKYKAGWWWSLGLTIIAAGLRGMENLMYDTYDYPDKLHEFMKFLSDGMMHYIDKLEDVNLLTQNTGNTYVGSGGFGFTGQIKPKNGNVKAKDMWGFAESQETGLWSTEMFEEFVFPYQLPLLSRFALNCYGCCEPLEKRWNVIKKIPRLRRVSVSPWANVDLMAEMLGVNYVFSLKPNPSALAGKNLNEEQARQELSQKLAAARKYNCHTEVIMKDNHTLGGNPDNAVRWVEIAREEIRKIFG